MTFSIKRKTLKKIVSSLTMFATVVSMSGFMALSTVVAADAIVDGDLIKSNATNSDGTPTVASLDVYIVKVVGTKQFKRLILNPTVFESYTHFDKNGNGNAWDEIQTVSQAVMDEYTTSSLVRVDTDPDEKVFAMAPDGDIGSKSWVNLTTDQFVTEAGSDADSIYTINAVDGGNYTAVGDVTTVAELTTFYADGSLPGVVPVPAGNVSVSLSASTPASGTLVAGQAVADLAHFNFAGNGTVKTVVLQRTGISANADLGNIYLFEGNTRITDAGSLNSSSLVTFNSAAGLFTVNGTKTISVRADVASTATGTIAMRMNSFTDTVATTSVNISGNSFGVVTASSIATVAFGATTPSGTPAVNAGAMNYTVWSNPVTVGVRAVNLNAVSFRYIGSAPVDALENINLFLNGSQIATGGVVNSLGNIVFDLGSAPVVINTGVQTLSVRADVIKGSNRNFQISIQNVADVMVEDSQLAGVYVSATSVPTTTSAGTITINAGSVSVTVDTTLSGTIAGGSSGIAIAKYAFKAFGEDMKVTSLVVTPAVATGTPATTSMRNVMLYADGSQIGTSQHYTATALTYSLGSSLIIPAGETVTIEVKADTINNAATPVNYTAGTLTVLLAGVTNNAQGISSSNLTTAPSTTGVTSTALTIGAASGSVALSSALNSKNVVSNTQATKIGSYVISAGSVEGIKVTNLQVGLTFGAAAPLYASGTVTAGSQSITVSTSTANIAVGDVITIPGATAAVGTVTSITSATVFVATITTGGVTPTVGGTITGTTAPMTITNVTNLSTSENTTPIAPSATNDFPVDFTLAKSTSKVVDVYADLGSLNAGTVQSTLLITAISTVTNSTLTTGTGIASALSGQTMTVAAGSVATPTLTTASLPAQFVVSASSPALATYNFVATNGDATITDLVFTMTGTNTTAVNSIEVGGVSAPVVSGGVATLSGLNIAVPAGYSGQDVVVTPTYNVVGIGGQTSNLTSIMTLTTMTYKVGNATTIASPGVAANTMTLVGTKPVVTLAGSTDTLGNSTVKVLEATVTADATGDLRLTALPITVTSTGAVNIVTAADNIVVRDTSGTLVTTTNTGLAVATNASGSDTILFTGGYLIPKGTSKTFRIYVTPVGVVATNSLSSKLGVSSSLTWTDVNGNVAGITGALIANYPTDTFVIKNY